MGIVNTGIKATSKFLDILHSCIGQMSDGIWENTRSMEKYWKSLSIETSPAGEIIINDRNYVCASPADFMANKIKQIIKIEIDDGNSKLSWDRACAGSPHYIGYGSTSITVGDCYQLYELLKGRATDRHTYSSYSKYDVELHYEDSTLTFEVEALTESQAKEQAIALLSRRLIATITKK